MAFCHHCGAALASGDELFCARCGTPVRPAMGGGALAYQGVGIRFVAQLIDAVPSLVFYLAAGRLVAGVVGGVTESGFELKGGPAFLVIGLTTAFWIHLIFSSDRPRRLHANQIPRARGHPFGG